MSRTELFKTQLALILGQTVNRVYYEYIVDQYTCNSNPRFALTILQTTLPRITYTSTAKCTRVEYTPIEG